MAFLLKKVVLAEGRTVNKVMKTGMATYQHLGELELRERERES